jgi:hypothetical protein
MKKSNQLLGLLALTAGMMGCQSETPSNTVGGDGTTGVTWTGAESGDSTDGTGEGNGDGDGDGDGDNAAPEAVQDLALSYAQIKQFNFTWTASAGAEHYKLLERQSATGNYEQVGSDTTSTSMSLTVPLHRRLGASYIVQACNASVCTDSAPVDVVGHLAEAVGYV